jgi:hypothetical protein
MLATLNPWVKGPNTWTKVKIHIVRQLGTKRNKVPVFLLSDPESCLERAEVPKVRRDLGPPCLKRPLSYGRVYYWVISYI